jgi:hypothetical protein
MKRTFPFLIIASLLLGGCRNPGDIPDVSGIRIDIQIERFDKDLFAMDSNRIPEQLPELIREYPSFTPRFLQNVLFLGPSADTPVVVYRELRHFLAQNQQLKDSVFKKFPSLDNVKAPLTQSFRFLHYYYPDYQIPKIITFIGNFGYKNIITDEGLGIGLDFYMGASFSYYQIPEVQEVFPSYLSRKFAPEYIPVDCMNAVIDDLYPTDNDTLPLIDQLIDRGKRLYILDKFLPGTNDTLKLGYTGKQYAWCMANEGQIWHALVQQNVLYSLDPDVVKNYLSDAPTTQTMPAGSPGNIGSFLGEQIVRQYVGRNGRNISPKKLMAVPTREIFSQAQYNPK